MKDKGTFASPNVVNLPGYDLTNNEISLLSKRLKFVSTLRDLSKALTKEEMQTYGRKL